MKAILKLLWFFGMTYFKDYLYQYIEIIKKEKVVSSINEYLPFLDSFMDVQDVVYKIYDKLNLVIFFTVLFLGLDLINGQFKGLKGPFKIVLNAIIYAIGFGILFILVIKGSFV